MIQIKLEIETIKKNYNFGFEMCQRIGIRWYLCGCVEIVKVRKGKISVQPCQALEIYVNANRMSLD